MAARIRTEDSNSGRTSQWERRHQTGRTYNQNHVPRPYTPGKRRFSIYWTWSYPWEANRDPTELDNRFSTMTEVRRVAWPSFEKPEWDKMNFLQGIAGTLELFHRSTLAFQQIVGETTGHPVAVYQRIDQAGYKLPIDETDPRGHGHADGLRPGPPRLRAGGRAGGNRRHPGVARAGRHLPAPGAASRRRLHRRHEAAPDGVQASRRRARAAPAALRPVHALADERARSARAQSVRAPARRRAGDRSDRAAHRSTRISTSWVC